MKAVGIAVFLLIGYFLGSINPAIIYSRIKGQDIRTMGSGNAGATNTLRNFGGKAALIVSLCDILKCALAVTAAAAVSAFFGEEVLNAKLLGATGCILGHNFPVYFSFKGGKGVLVSVTALFMTDWRIGAAALLAFIIVFLLSRYVSLGSVIGAVTASAVALAIGEPEKAVFTLFAAVLTIVRHRSNIKRLINGTESKTKLSSHKEKE